MGTDWMGFPQLWRTYMENLSFSKWSRKNMKRKMQKISQDKGFFLSDSPRKGRIKSYDTKRKCHALKQNIQIERSPFWFQLLFLNKSNIAYLINQQKLLGSKFILLTETAKTSVTPPPTYIKWHQWWSRLSWCIIFINKCNRLKIILGIFSQLVYIVSLALPIQYIQVFKCFGI